MSRDPYRTGPTYRLPIAIAVVAALLIGGILILTGGDDDPVSQALVPPVASDSFTAEQKKDAAARAAAQSGAIDGAPMDKSEIPAGLDHDDHHVSEPPSDQATNAGPLVATATRFADLMINRPTDQLESSELNKELITLAYGTLATGLRDSTGDIATAQAPSSGEILDSILLTRESDYAEVLIVAKESLVDPTTRQQLDPHFLNYVVRLDRIDGKDWAVTSWEPQL